MATSEEKQELVDHLSGPRFYRVTINGYGGESAYMSISKEAHDFWKAQTDEHGDYDLVQYMVSDDDEEVEYEDIDEVPADALFLHDVDDDNYKRPWYESHTEFEHSYGAEYGSARIDIDEVDSDDYSAKHIAEVYSGIDVTELMDQVLEETNNEVDILEMGVCEGAGDDTQYIAQLYSSEKGCFFDGVIETVGDFDSKKLKIYTTEFLNGEDTITSIEYDGVEIDNGGGDTNGKGYLASVWEADD
jgi:hypothetical protein